MAKPKANESNKITGDKFEPLIDETVNRDSRRRKPQDGERQRERESNAGSDELQFDDKEG